ncbi:MAG: 5-formyltetrahydrofolate cyclo-ligase [Candidatus Peregrinibacteria bacterium]|nr:5-formyltetrahydrofolate cyclo-ligase [Patescibacteria group bacterium]MBU1702817.1 5-formyltetrahydrofolate cyclo-ligase [Patescibacteria group bacterium]MBU1953790.1 5-formyltetrahydrofolate cyclo-ligase [Patescibacteria group bacterium]
MKKQIREQILYKRTQQSPRDKAPKDKKIIETIEKLPEFQNAQNILIYIAIHGEVDLSQLFNKYKGSKNFILPRLNQSDSSLILYHIKSLDDLEKGTFSIPEPKEDLEKIPLEKIDLAIIPGVAFALDGNRIGYGGGSFDRLLLKLNCTKIGIAYQFQIVENIAGEDHDQKVDLIITEANIIHIPNP